MGKIRTKTLGSEEEAEQKKKDKARREGKRLREKKELKEEEPEEIADKEEITAVESESPESEQLTETENTDTVTPKKPEAPKHIEGKKYRQVKTFVDRTKKYPVNEAVKIAKKTSYTKFDGTIEAHFNTTEKGIRGNVTLPHGTGKAIRIAEASDELIAEIETGKINFDILISTPQMMPKLAKVAKVLGPKGLMPNPKSGTITTEPEKLKEKLSKGQIQFKTENEFPLLHASVGKVSFEDEKLIENLRALVEAISRKKIVSLSLNCTMGPGIKVSLESI